MSSWYVVIEEQIEGPYSARIVGEMLHSKRINRNSFVTNDFDDWKIIREVSEILEYQRYAFYVLRSANKHHPLKVGITDNPRRRVLEHRQKSNIDYKLFRQKWFPNEYHARKFEKYLVKNLWLQGYERVCNEFFFISPDELDQVLYGLKNL